MGAQGGLEERLVPKAGFPLLLLRLGALKGQSWVGRLRTLVRLPLAFLKGSWILLRFRPDCVLGVGGYASGPVVLLARMLGWLWGARTAILEQNAVTGFSNRILGQVVHQIFVAFPGMEKQFPGRSVVVTGNPVRESIVRLPSAARQPFVVFVFGGSQGAAGINTLVLDSLPILADLRGRVRWIHQTGEKDFDRVMNGHRDAGWSDSRVEKFIDDMPACYAQASLLVCRAGSSTLAEIAAVGRAAVLVPYPFASDNHQEKNARIFTDAGAARILIQGKATGRELADLIRSAVENPAGIDLIEKNALKFHRENSAGLLASML